MKNKLKRPTLGNLDAEDALKKRVEYLNQRGQGADHVVPSDPELRQAIESHIAEEFANAYARQYGKQIIDIRSNEDDPPDCFASEDGKQFGIEITELVKHEIRADNVAEWHRAKPSTPEEKIELMQGLHAKNYERSLWTKEELLGRLQGVITKKDEKKGLADCAETMRVVLVIYTDDQNLPKTDLTSWLANVVFSAQNLKEVFLRGPHQAQSNKQLRPNPDDPNAWERAVWVTPDYPLFRLRLTDNIRAS